jgi:type II secretory pathway pseudopilin PulG
MEWLLVILLVAAVAAVAISSARQKQRRALEEAAALASVRRVADEDVTRFGEELQQLHIETMTTKLDVAMQQDYQRALDAYENAKLLLTEASSPGDVSEITRTLEDGRYAQACVLARQDGEPLPQRRPPCFFNPSHGPAQTDVEWAPYGGAPREVPVCLADAERVRAGAEPDARTVRSGNRMVPWYEGGRAYAPYANGYYGAYAMAGLFPGFLIGSMMAGIWSTDAVTDPSGGDSGGWDGGDSGGDGGGDYGGGDAGGDYGGGDGGGGGDFGGDFGGGDFGGF